MATILLWGIVLGVGTGLTALVLGAMVASRWFTSNRGLVVGLFAASTATGQLLFLPVAAWIIDHFGWRLAVLPVVFTCLCAGLLVIAFMRDYPQDVGLAALGEPADQAEQKAPARAPLNFMAPFTLLAEVSGNKTFWMLAGSFFICGLSTNGLIQTHFAN